jgi:hypothetical protein
VNRASDVRRVTFAIAFIIVIGAMAFGVWHVVVGGLVNGNPRAAAFGVVLAAGAGSAILGLLTLGRRPGRG